MKTLLLGATGSVGSRLVPALLVHKHQVVVFVRSESKLKSLLPQPILSKITVVVGDAADADAISRALIENQCDAIVNSAGQSTIFPWQAPRMQNIINAVTTASVDASKKLNHPIRGWLMGGMTCLDVPGMPGTPITRYFPMFTEHDHTYARLSSLSQNDLEWSLLCPSQMAPVSKTIESIETPRSQPMLASADIPPGWQNSSLHSIPFIGPLISIFGNASKYYITLEDCAEFIANDLENANSEFVGHRVGLMEGKKGKSD